MDDIRIYTPPPTGVLFHQDNESVVKLIMGPVSSGKSSTSCNEIIKQLLMLPRCTDGVRRGRWIITRNTYPELKMTTLKTWQAWYPERGLGRLYKQSPFFHDMRFKDQHGVECNFEIYFLSMDSEDDISKLLSLETTGFYFNELREFPVSVLQAAISRLMCRYPSKAMLGLPEDFQGLPYIQQILADTNPPPLNHWIRKYFDSDERIPGWKMYKQPPAMIETIIDERAKWIINPDRENKIGTPDEAVIRAAQSLDPEMFKVFILGEYGSVYEGKPVHPAYKPHIHYSKTVIQPVANEPIYIGWDFGLTPACVVGQYINGQLRILDEYYTFDQNLRQFLANSIKPAFSVKYADWINSGNYVSTGDPSGATPGQATGVHCLQVLAEFGINTQPAYTNAPQVRQDALNVHLNKMNMGEPGMLVSVNAEFVNEALSGAYRYSLLNSRTGYKKYHTVPEKNEWSHTAEAAQYMAMPLNSMQPKKEMETEEYFDGLHFKMRFK